MVTGTEDVQAAVETLTNGAGAYLLKPVQREQLLFHARRALKRRTTAIRKRRYTRKLEKTVRRQEASTFTA